MGHVPDLVGGQAGAYVGVYRPQQLARRELHGLLERRRLHRPGRVRRGKADLLEPRHEALLNQLAAELCGRNLLEMTADPEPVLHRVGGLRLDQLPGERQAGDHGQRAPGRLPQRHQPAGDLLQQERHAPVLLDVDDLCGLGGLGDQQIDLIHRDDRRTGQRQQAGDVTHDLLRRPFATSHPPPGAFAGLHLVVRAEVLVPDVLRVQVLGSLQGECARGVLTLHADLAVLLAQQVDEGVERGPRRHGVPDDGTANRSRCLDQIDQAAQEDPELAFVVLGAPGEPVQYGQCRAAPERARLQQADQEKVAALWPAPADGPTRAGGSCRCRAARVWPHPPGSTRSVAPLR